jgi:outer membrane lipoprotein-sorting protein
MRSRFVIYIVLAAVVVAAVIAGVVAAASAGQTNTLPQVSAADLLAKMAQQDQKTTSISGDVAWKNSLLGDLSAASSAGFGGSAAAKLPLAGDGSGRVWMSPDGVRVESQGASSDQIVVVNKKTHGVWTYDGAANTAMHVVVTGTPTAGTEPSPMASAAVATPATIASYIERLAPLAKVEVSGQSTIAGQDAYLLTLTPTATDTALGSVQVAIDGKTYVPLQLQVFAKGATTPVIQFGFTSVSYGAIPASTFDFTPPAGAKVTTKTIDASKMMNGHKTHKGSWTGKHAKPTKAQLSAMQRLLKSAFLSVPAAQKLVHYHVYSPQGYTARPFDMAAVVGKGGPLTAVGKPLMSVLQASGMMSGKGGVGGMGALMGGNAQSTLPKGAAAHVKVAPMGPTTVLLYGKGFGTIALAETRSTAALDKQLKALPALVDTATVNGATVRSLTTALGGVYIWQKGDTTLVAGGMVPKADLQAFVSSVQ